jgi:hypothetical protein
MKYKNFIFICTSDESSKVSVVSEVKGDIINTLLIKKYYKSIDRDRIHIVRV